MVRASCQMAIVGHGFFRYVNGQDALSDRLRAKDQDVDRPLLSHCMIVTPRLLYRLLHTLCTPCVGLLI
jgi:hypothetical protein